MVSLSASLASLALAVAVIAPQPSQVDAHGYVIAPKAQGNGKGHPGTFVTEFPPPWSGTWKDPKVFAAAAKEKGFSTLRSYLEDKGATCGFTDPNVSPRAIPSDKKIRFSRDIPHPGPCELWIDDKRVYQNDDCESAFAGTIPSWDVDWSLCSGKCMLRFYWLGLQASGTRWQVYKNCVPVTGSGGASSESNSSSSKTPASTTKAPSSSSNKTPTVTTKAPSSNNNNNKSSKTPSATTAKTPQPSTKEVGGDADGQDADDDDNDDDDKDGDDDDDAASNKSASTSKSGGASDKKASSGKSGTLDIDCKAKTRRA